MQMALRVKEVELLNRVLRTPNLIPDVNFRGAHSPYQARDSAGARELVSLRKWLELKVMKPSVKTEGREQFVFEAGETYQGGLRKPYAQRLTEVLKHYEDVLGLTVSDAEVYWRIRDMLDGKSVAEENLDDVEDPWKEKTEGEDNPKE